MKDRLSLLYPPQLDDDHEARAAMLLHFILIAGVLVTALSIIVRLISQDADIAQIERNLVVLTVEIGLFVLLRRGLVRLAGIILVASGWLVVYFATSSQLGVLNPAFGGFTLVVVTAGLLIGGWAALVCAIVSVAYGLWLVTAAANGAYPVEIGDFTTQSTLTTHASVLVLSGLFLFLTQRALRQAEERSALDREATRASEEQYRQLFQNNPHPMYVVDIETLDYLAVNDAAVDSYGYSRNEFLSMSSRDIRPAEDMPAVMRQVDKFQQQQLDFDVSGPWQHRKNDGTIIQVETAAHRLTYKGRDAALIAAYDLTARLEAEADLRRSEELFSKVFQSVPVAIAISTLDEARLLSVNPYQLKLLGYTLDEVINHRVSEVGFWFSLSEREDLLNELRKNGVVAGVEEKWIKKSGETLDILYSMQLIEVAGETSVLGIGINITERKREEQKRLENERVRLQNYKEREVLDLKEKFISTMSHEFRTPLAVVLSAKEMLVRYFDRLTPERRLEKLDVIEEQVRYVSDILDDVLMLSKARSGKMQYNPSPVDLIALCRKVFDQVKTTDTQQHQFIFDTDAQSGEIMSDVGVLQHILVNLLSNAIKYSPDAGVVRLAVNRDGEEVVITVSDEGIGIPEDDQKRLFESFFRASNVDTIKGTGLGLAIVKESVETCRGTISCESQVGKGTTFTVRLPIAYEETPAGEESAAAPSLTEKDKVTD